MEIRTVCLPASSASTVVATTLSDQISNRLSAKMLSDTCGNIKRYSDETSLSPSVVVFSRDVDRGQFYARKSSERDSSRARRDLFFVDRCTARTAFLEANVRYGIGILSECRNVGAWLFIGLRSSDCQR
jgi:hypothetical protein